MGLSEERAVDMDVVVVLQVEAAPNSGPMLAVARNLRTEKDREERLQKQKYEQKNLVSHPFFLCCT